MKFKTVLIIIILYAILSMTDYMLYASYSDDGLTRKQAISYIASGLFNIPLNSIDDSTNGANYWYNDWAWNPGLFSLGYSGGHGGVDIQTKDVEGSKTVDRPFFSLTGGEVVAADQDIYKTIAVYDSANNRTILYLHARSVFVNVGDIITFGQKLGIQGNSGMGYSDQTSSEHLHFEIQAGKKMNPSCGADCSIDPVNIIYETIVTTPLWDVQDKSVWYYPYIHCLYNLEIVSGYLDGSFKPENPVNRAEFIKMVVLALELALGYEWSGYCPSPPPWNIDLVKWQWYYIFLLKAYNYINYSVFPYERLGFWPTNQSVDFSQRVTREEAAHIVRNALGLSSYNFTGAAPFSDVPIISTFAPWVYKIWEAGIIDGYNDNKFKPENVLNRAEAAKIIRNILRYKGFINYTSNSIYPEICNCD